MRAILLILNFIALIAISSAFSTGFWYGQTRAPEENYDSVAYANLTVRINRPIDEGPGQNLLWDPYKTKQFDNLFVGNTINRQTFQTQFILDLVEVLGINASRVFVTNIVKGTVHFSWESSNVIVYFIILERNDLVAITLLEAVSDLTILIQTPNSTVYTRRTNVTNNIDPEYGLELINWDNSLKLSYAIEVVGGNAVIDDYINLGGLNVCNREGASNFSYYCEFERFFEDDLSLALNISYYRVKILFIKRAAVDGVYIYFRISPSRRDSTELDVPSAVAALIMQVQDLSSLLYQGIIRLKRSLFILSLILILAIMTSPPQLLIYRQP
jgi:hypothetical protein